MRPKIVFLAIAEQFVRIIDYVIYTKIWQPNSFFLALSGEGRIVLCKDAASYQDY